MTDMEMIGVRVTQEKRDEIEGQLDYGDTITEWCRDAFEMKLFIDQLADAHPGELPDQWWEDAIEMYLNDSGADEGNCQNQTATATN